MTASGIGEFVSGLILGVLLGLVLGPILRFWLAWHEWVAASRGARLTEDVLRRMDAGPWGTSRGGSSTNRPGSNGTPKDG
jgi:hypothetical protein